MYIHIPSIATPHTQENNLPDSSIVELRRPFRFGGLSTSDFLNLVRRSKGTRLGQPIRKALGEMSTGILSRRSSSTECDKRRIRHSATCRGNQENQPPTTTRDSNSKSCCFCWCCCCSCSFLTVKNDDGKQVDMVDHDELMELPTLEELKSWRESFDRLMKSKVGRRCFREFLRSEYSEENMLFWVACEDLKMEDDPEVVEEKARLIYEDYISILSPREVSLDSKVRETVNRNMVQPAKTTFAEAQGQIYTLMHRDSYPRFLNSPRFKLLLQQVQ